MPLNLGQPSVFAFGLFQYVVKGIFFFMFRVHTSLWPNGALCVLHTIFEFLFRLVKTKSKNDALQWPFIYVYQRKNVGRVIVIRPLAGPNNIVADILSDDQFCYSTINNPE